MDIYFKKNEADNQNNQGRGSQVYNASSNQNDPIQKEAPHFENYDIHEHKEKELNDKLDKASSNNNNNLTIAYKNCIEYDMSKRKREMRMKREDKGEIEKIRRWHVKINNIYITPLMKMIDPFIQFTIGGNFMVNVYKNKNGETYKIPAGIRGYCDKTEVLQNLSPPQENEANMGGRAAFEKVIDIEMRMSYSMLSNEKMMIELWEHNNFWMNEIHSYLTINLLDIANGPSNITEYLTKAEEGKKNPLPFAMIEFNCLFQEIWDFNIQFLNWKSTTLLNPKRKRNAIGETQSKPQADSQSQYLSTKLKLEFISANNDAMKTCCTSEVSKESNVPIWTNFSNTLMYRGTCLELENEEIRISLISTVGLFNRTLCQKNISLKGIIDYERLKTDLMLHDKENEEAYPVTIEGIVSFDNKPKYIQTGQNVLLLSTRKYLVIKVMRIENIRPAESKGIVNSFVSIEWSGMNQRTRSVIENNNPAYNELLYFQVPLPENWLGNIDKYILKINEELSTKNEVTFNLMIEGDDNSYDNFGIGYFYLSDIKGSNKFQEHYFAEDLKKDKNYISEKFTGKIKLVSAFSQSTDTFIHFEAWFLDNFPPNVSFGEKKKQSERADKIPPELKEYFPQGKDSLFNKEFKNKVHGAFMNYSNYDMKDRQFFNLNPQDQYTKTHLLPYYISPISLPEKKYSTEDKRTNPNFFNGNLSTLDEVAHYVRCFPYPNELKNDILASPDFMVKLKKGNVEEHAVLMACLMLGIRKKIDTQIKDNDDINYNDDNDDDKETAKLLNKKEKKKEKTKGKKDKTNITLGPIIDSKGTSKDSDHNDKTQSKTNDIVLTEGNISEEGSFPYEHHVFVCLGKLKQGKTNHMWVMTLDNGYRDITFWDSKLDIKFELKGRVKEPEKLRHFLQGDYSNYTCVNMNLRNDNDGNISRQKTGKKRIEIEEIILKGQNEESVYKYQDEDDFYDDFANESQSNLGIKKQDIRFMIDNKIAYDPNETGKRSVFDFIAHDKSIDKEIDKGHDRHFLPNELFKDRSGEVVQDVNLPYETIDLIFTQNNIWANCQFHNPEQIFYNLYDKTQWLPYINLDDLIWRGKFEPFYSLSHFGAIYSPSLVNKMILGLTKEIRIAIASARSSKNLPTRFKKKNEKINQQLTKYLDYIENNKLGRLLNEEFKLKHDELNVVIKKHMPKFYRMEAQTVFFNFYETEIIRRAITEDLEPFWNTKIKNVLFATCGKVYAYPNQIVSVRIMIAKFYKIPLEDISNKEEEEEYIKMMKEERNGNSVEEEVESEEEEDNYNKEEEVKVNDDNNNKDIIGNTYKNDIERQKILEKKVIVETMTKGMK